jgi:hypothetical protein
MGWRALAVVLASVLATLAGGAVGCSSSSNDPVTISLDDFPAAFARRYCHRVYGCCLPEDRAEVSPGADEVACTAGMTENARANGELLLSAGGIAYFPIAAARCLSDLDGSVCADLFKESDASLAVCQDVFAGTRANGMACADHKQCASGTCTGTCADPADCSAGAVADDSNVCVPRVGLGAACTVTAQCPAAAGCVNDLCVARAADGSPCNEARDCLGTCANTAAGFFCRAPLCRGL